MTTLGEVVQFALPTSSGGRDFNGQPYSTRLTVNGGQLGGQAVATLTLSENVNAPVDGTFVVTLSNLQDLATVSSNAPAQLVEATMISGEATLPTANTLPLSTTEPSIETTTSSIQPSTATQSTGTVDAADGSASSSSSPTFSSKSQNGLQAGAVAGIAVGCAAAGALIALLLAFLCFRRRKRSSSPRTSDSQQSYYDENASKAPLVTAVPVQRARTNSALDNMLPMPATGRELGDQFAALSAAIAEHVDSFYANGQVTAASYTNSLTPLLGNRSPLSQDQLQDMLSRPSERIGAIRFLIAWSILRNIEPDAPPETTLLPPDLAESMAYMSVAGSDRSAPDHALLLARWRQLSGELLKSRYGDGSIVRSDSREQNMSELASMLNTVLEPYATDRNNAGRLQALKELIKSGARLGYLLFIQPTSWRFAWDQPMGSGKGEMVVFPKLVQVRDEHGILHGREQYFGLQQTVPTSR